MPLLSIAVALAFLRRPERSWRFMIVSGALLGIGLLAYGTVIIAVALALVALVVAFWIKRERPGVAPGVRQGFCFPRSCCGAIVHLAPDTDAD